VTKKQPIPFGKYLLLDRVNIGGMAEVWKAKTFGAEGFEKLVAIKRILPNIAEDEEFISMFIDEAKISVQLTHANVAQVFDLGKIGESYYIAMEYVSGRDLRAIFDKARKRGEPAPIPLVCYALSKASEGLDYAHRKRDAQGDELNIVHRDVSPQNILCSFDGETKVIDFGIAKAANKATKTQAGILKGKFGYMSPEQVRGLPLDRRSDVFALGVVLYEMLTGERLFVGESDFSVLEKVRAVDILPPSTYNRRIPAALEKIVLKALAKDVDNRFSYASELGDELQRFLITSDTIFSRKDLQQFMKSTFAEDVEREKMKLAEYSEIKLPPGMAALAGLAPLPVAPAKPAPVMQPSSDATMIRAEAAPAAGAPRPAAPRLSGIRPAISPPPVAPAVNGVRGAGPPPTAPARPAVAPGRQSTGQIPAIARGASSPGMGAVKPPPPVPRLEPVSAPVAEDPEFDPDLDPEPTHGAGEGGLGADIDSALERDAKPPPRQPTRVKRALTPEALDHDGQAQAAQGGKRKLPLLLGVAGGVVALGLAGFFLLGKPTGTLLVNCTPSENLVILLDGESVGTVTPYMNPKVAAGPHSLQIASKGYEILTKQITVEKQQTNTEELSLARKGFAPVEDKKLVSTEKALIFRKTDGAEVTLDGKVVLAKDAKDSIWSEEIDGAVEHVVEAKLAGFKTQTEKVPAGTPVKVTVELQKDN
jgi:serine/threonine protein kinase